MASFSPTHQSNNNNADNPVVENQETIEIDDPVDSEKEGQHVAELEEMKNILEEHKQVIIATKGALKKSNEELEEKRKLLAECRIDLKTTQKLLKWRDEELEAANQRIEDLERRLQINQNAHNSGRKPRQQSAQSPPPSNVSGSQSSYVESTQTNESNESSVKMTAKRKRSEGTSTADVDEPSSASQKKTSDEHGNDNKNQKDNNNSKKPSIENIISPWKSYTDKIEKKHPGYLHELYLHAIWTLGQNATFESIALEMNRKSALPGEERTTLTLNRSKVRFWYRSKTSKPRLVPGRKGQR